MVNLVFKYKNEIFIFLLLTALYFLFRLPNLTLQPIFADEAIYIRWAQVMKSEPTLRFLPLSDGKTPLFMWAMIPLFKFIHDPLLAGRFLSVVSGFFTLLGVFFLSKKVFGSRTAFWASLLYVITPYTVFFDRMALVDSMLTGFTIWLIYFAVWLTQSLKLSLSMILGYLLGGAILTKTPGMINLLLLPISLLGFNRKKVGKHALVKLVVFWAVAVVLALSMYNILRLGPNFQLLSARNTDYVFSPQELSGRPLDPFIPHFRDMADWFPKLLTWPILFCLAIGIFYVALSVQRLGILILAWALVPLLLDMAFLKTFTARYLLPSIPLLLIISGFGVTRLLPRLAYIKRLPILLMLVVVLPLPLYFNYLLLTSPSSAPLPREERKGYFEDWTAGYGLKEIADYLISQSKKGSVVVGTEGFFGTLPEGLYIYLDKSDISVMGQTATISAKLRNAAKDHLTFFVGNKKNLQGSIDRVNLIKEFPKAKPPQGVGDATLLYQVLDK